MPRRRSLLSLLAAASAAVLPAPAAAAPARSAGAFVDSVGVNTHIIYDDTAYGDFATVRARLKELGVRHIRDGICGTCLWQWERYETLATDGIRLNAGAGWPNATALQRTQALAAMRRLAPMIETIEGANEWDLFSGRTSTWPTEVRAHQSWLANAVRADAALRTKPIIGPSLVFSWETPSSWTILNDVSANLDYGNSHGYAGGLAPELAVDAELARAGQISGTKPMIQTEGGYHNALGQGNWDHPAVPEDVAGAYMPRMFLENFRRGVRRTYSYELLDEWHGQARTNMEASFGLLRSDFGRKPAYDSLRNLLTVLGEPGAPAGTTEVPVIVSTTGGDVRQLLLRKADGRVAVVLWRAASLWDRVARTRTAVATVPVTVAYTGTVLTAATYAPVESAMARRGDARRWRDHAQRRRRAGDPRAHSGADRPDRHANARAAHAHPRASHADARAARASHAAQAHPRAACTDAGPASTHPGAAGLHADAHADAYADPEAAQAAPAAHALRHGEDHHGQNHDHDQQTH